MEAEQGRYCNKADILSAQFIASRKQPCKLRQRHPEGGEFIGRGIEIQYDR